MIFSRSAHSKSDEFFVVLKVSLKKKNKARGLLVTHTKLGEAFQNALRDRQHLFRGFTKQL